MDIYWKQLKSLLTHKWYALKAGLMVGDISLWRLSKGGIIKSRPLSFTEKERVTPLRTDEKTVSKKINENS